MSSSDNLPTVPSTEYDEPTQIYITGRTPLNLGHHLRKPTREELDYMVQARMANKKVHWDKIGIGQALALTIANSAKDGPLMAAATYFWSSTINAFLFNHGPMTPTLINTTMITGLDVTSSANPMSMNTKNQFDFKTKSIGGWSGYVAAYMGKGPITPREHVAFLLMWLEKFLFCGSSYGPTTNWQFVAEALESKKQFPLGKILLGNLYQMLNNASAKIAVGSVVGVGGPWWLLQTWLNLMVMKVVNRPSVTKAEFPRLEPIVEDARKMVTPAPPTGWDFSTGDSIRDEVWSRFGSPVHFSSHFSRSTFRLVVDVPRSSFRLTSSSVALALRAAIGGSPSDLHVDPLIDRSFTFLVCSKKVGLWIYSLRSFSCKDFSVRYFLWKNGGPDWRREWDLWQAEQYNEWTIVKRRYSSGNRSQHLIKASSVFDRLKFDIPSSPKRITQKSDSIVSKEIFLANSDPKAVGLFKFGSAMVRDLLVYAPPFMYDGIHQVNFVRHDQSPNWRAAPFTRTVWFLLLDFPLDYINMQYICLVVSSFGQLEEWYQNDPIEGKVLVRAMFKDFDSVPRKIVLQDPTSGAGESWTISVFTLEGDFADIFPPDEDLPPTGPNNDENPDGNDDDDGNQDNIWQFGPHPVKEDQAWNQAAVGHQAMDLEQAAPENMGQIDNNHGWNLVANRGMEIEISLPPSPRKRGKKRTPFVDSQVRRSGRLLALRDGFKNILQEDPNMGVGKPRGKAVKKLKQLAEKIGSEMCGTSLEEVSSLVDLGEAQFNPFGKIMGMKDYYRLAAEFYYGTLDLDPLNHSFIILVPKKSVPKVLVNGIPRKNFHCKRGVRQGDPLPPLLFVLGAELLQVIVNRAYAMGHLSKPFPSDFDPNFPIVQYADDTLLYLKASG
uniref:Uncharacterized protein n=1 Tax=Oryza sativa subsp. japonica TaxID=39947 RepID=Q75H48_ORYSJ|nr:hypothetical protein [Oryza sativa Japonica Group]